MNALAVRVAGTGFYAPDEVLTSEALEEQLALPPGWIERRTGIRERRVAGVEQAVSDLAAAAAQAALGASGVSRARVSLVILATSTPDHPLPATAPSVASRLGLTAPAFDLAAACSGFLYGLALAGRWLASPTNHEGDAVLVIGANVLSRRVDWTDANTAPLFGDGAGAVVFCASRPGIGGILAVDLHSDGGSWEDIYIPAGGSRRPVSAEAIERGETRMVMAHGSRLFRRAVRTVVESSRRALEHAGLRANDIDWFVPHQGSGRIIEKSAEALGISEGRVIANVARYGNTSAASIPMALHEAAADGRLRSGDLVLLAAAGGGLTGGAAVLKWG